MAKAGKTEKILIASNVSKILDLQIF